MSPQRARPARTGPPRRERGFGLLALLTILVAVPATLLLAGVLTLGLSAILAADRLPSLDVLTDYRPKVPLRVWTADGVLIGEFGEERRSVVRIDEVPAVMRNAILAAEDDRFFEHSGVDVLGIVRAAFANVAAGGKTQGASTITMQLARNFFLSNERSYTRKIYEILLALKIESTLSKEQILEIYLNQIFLGQRAYGFASAAQIYYGKPLAKITAAEAAMLAGLPKAPSAFNPVVNPKRARIRQQYVLGRMRSLGSLTEEQYQAAIKEELRLQPDRGDYAVKAPYVAELARMLAFDQFRDETYVAGLNVHTTVLSEDQRAANAAVRDGVLAYDRRYGFRGPEAQVELPADPQRRDEKIEEALLEAGEIDDFLPAVVVVADPKVVRIARSRGQTIEITGDGLKLVAPWLSEKAPANRRLKPGAVIRVAEGPKGWEVTQVPEVQAAFVSANTGDGSIRAMVGGFDFSRNKFNRVTQAWRQPGSSFKPFIYSASLEKGFMTTTVINDAPVIVDPAVTGGQVWEPKNYDGKFDGPMTMRSALAKSKNMVSIRLLQAIGPQYAQDYVTRFGFDAERHPPYLTMALGAGAVTPWQMVGGIAVFANGGYRVDPYLISKVTDASGRVLAQARPAKAGDESIRAIDARNAFLMDSLLKDVVRRGTATMALRLKRTDLAGKTGTTNDSHDAWFAGYVPKVAAVAWVGFDQPRKLGDRETGGGLALPIWVHYMGVALRGVPDAPMQPPQGIVKVGDDWYYAETRPGQGIASLGVAEDGLGTGERGEQVREQVF
ncbi:MAG: penicillin-binding protein 1A [Burkholderiaceae bacterium]|jgi:penicillin-binding protein 1A|nr:penicillin-binding protein 1A [Burkholderiaceae bacterium]